MKSIDTYKKLETIIEMEGTGINWHIKKYETTKFWFHAIWGNIRDTLVMKST